MAHIDGFVPLASYDDECRSKQSGHSTQWKILREAISTGEVEGYQHGGSKRWLVNKVQADKYLLRHARQAEDRPAADGRTQLDCLIGIERSLAAILELLREQTQRVDSPQWHPEVSS